jgi:hypothetical protein
MASRQTRGACWVARKVIAGCTEQAQWQPLWICLRMGQPLEDLGGSSQTCSPISISAIARREGCVNKPDGVDQSSRALVGCERRKLALPRPEPNVLTVETSEIDCESRPSKLLLQPSTGERSTLRYLNHG